MKRDIAAVINGKIVAIYPGVHKDDVLMTCDVLADITLRPDLKVGDDYPPCSVAELESRQHLSASQVSPSG